MHFEHHSIIKNLLLNQINGRTPVLIATTQDKRPDYNVNMMVNRTKGWKELESLVSSGELKLNQTYINSFFYYHSSHNESNNLGIFGGSGKIGSSLAILDFDFMPTMEQLSVLNQIGILPNELTMQTTKRGMHMFFNSDTKLEFTHDRIDINDLPSVPKSSFAENSFFDYRSAASGYTNIIGRNYSDFIKLSFNNHKAQITEYDENRINEIVFSNMTDNMKSFVKSIHEKDNKKSNEKITKSLVQNNYEQFDNYKNRNIIKFYNDILKAKSENDVARICDFSSYTEGNRNNIIFNMTIAFALNGFDAKQISTALNHYDSISKSPYGKYNIEQTINNVFTNHYGMPIERRQEFSKFILKDENAMEFTKSEEIKYQPKKAISERVLAHYDETLKFVFQAVDELSAGASQSVSTKLSILVKLVNNRFENVDSGIRMTNNSLSRVISLLKCETNLKKRNDTLIKEAIKSGVDFKKNANFVKSLIKEESYKATPDLSKINKYNNEFTLYSMIASEYKQYAQEHFEDNVTYLEKFDSAGNKIIIKKIKNKFLRYLNFYDLLRYSVKTVRGKNGGMIFDYYSIEEIMSNIVFIDYDKTQLVSDNYQFNYVFNYRTMLNNIRRKKKPRAKDAFKPKVQLPA